MSDFVVNGEKQTTKSSWQVSGALNDDHITYVTTKHKVRDVKTSDTCPQYLYYDQVDPFLGIGGKNKIYLSNLEKKDFKDEDGDKISYDKRLTRLQYDEEKSPINATLNSLRCTYSFGVNNKLVNAQGILNYSFYIDRIENNIVYYSLWENYKRVYNGEFNVETGFLTTNTKYIDYFTIRNFWNEDTGQYGCPTHIAINEETKYDLSDFLNSDKVVEIGWYDENGQFMNFGTDLESSKWYQFTSNNNIVLSLNKNASYVDAKEKVEYVSSNYCTYSQTVCNPTLSTCSPNIEVTLYQYKYADGSSNWESVFTSSTPTSVSISISDNVDITTGEDESRCSSLNTIYTNCLDSNDCVISDEIGQVSNSKTLYTSDWANKNDLESTNEAMGKYNGLSYRRMICELSDKLSKYAIEYNAYSSLNLLPSLRLYDTDGIFENELSISSIDCSKYKKWTCENCKEDLPYYITTSVKDIKNFCNDVYSLYMDDFNDEAKKGRADECISFDQFYNELVALGIIQDQTEGCDFLSVDFTSKLIWVLDIIKIAAPIIALGLGTLDFIKVIANGDSDKEMKSAFKRFSTRILAAFLLFVVPIILAFLLDVFVGNQSGYDPDNPFCNVVDIK